MPQGVGAQAAGDRVRGKVAFLKNGCYECLRYPGARQPQRRAAVLTPHTIPYANFIAYIRAPKADMPPFSARVLSRKTSLQDIHAYLMSIPAGPQPDQIALLKDIDTGQPLSPALAHSRTLFVESRQKCHRIGADRPGAREREGADERCSRPSISLRTRRPPMLKSFPASLSGGDVADVAAYVQTL